MTQRAIAKHIALQELIPSYRWHDPEPLHQMSGCLGVKLSGVFEMNKTGGYDDVNSGHDDAAAVHDAIFIFRKRSELYV